jgi:hypothetical protein
MSRVGGFENAIDQLGLLLTADWSASGVQVDMVMKVRKNNCAVWNLIEGVLWRGTAQKEPQG